MAYVEPNSTIQIFKNVPLDTSYRHSFWFTSLSEQDGHFGTTYYGGYAGITFPENSYTRKARGYVRLNIKPDLIIAYNYMRYKNINHGNKWYYAFITSVDYVNENTAEVSFELDLIQTYMFDVVIRDSFVERQHNLTDNVGDNIIEESIGYGDDYIVEKHGTIISLTPNRLMLFIATANSTQASISFPSTPFSMLNSFIGKIGITTVKIPPSVTDQELANISTLINQQLAFLNDNDIVSPFLYNSVLDRKFTWHTSASGVEYSANFTGTLSPITSNTVNNMGVESVDLDNTTISELSDFNGYTPKNNKLLIYPYKYLEVHTVTGSTMDFKYELFYNRTPKFQLHAALMPKPEYMLYPKYYGGKGEPGNYSYFIGYEYGIPLDMPTSVPIATDAYKGYLLGSQGTRNLAVASAIMKMVATTAVMSSMSGGAGGAMGGAATGASAALTPTTGTAVGRPYGMLPPSTNRAFYEANFPNSGGAPYTTDTTLKLGKPDYATIARVLADMKNAQGLANGVVGSFTSDGLHAGEDRYNYEYNQLSIKREYAEIIDSYFTMFGYAQKKLMGVLSPSSSNVSTKNARRPYFNYTKTVGCNVFNANFVNNKIGCPSDALIAIAEIYNNGITFWNKDAQVGNYTYNNAPSTP